ncbi:MAG: alpha/beta hydrolase [Acidobacteria bacterium]|nr:alpha/beta hydrolase [Acidobacteriota bacterium]MCA1637760.1 alpha/beta hydrolase [Acidobacteriota bacterium]
MKLTFEEHGTGKPIVLLHAFPLSRKMWQPQIKALITKNCRVILPDLRGFGESHNFSDINSMEDMAKDVAELLEALKIERAIIGGLSMGGYVLFELFKLFPEKFAALILCDTSFAADSDDKRKARFDLIEKIEKSGAQILIEAMLPDLTSNNTKTNNQVLMIELEKSFAEVNAKAAVAALRGMAQRKDNSNVLDSVSLPTILIFGKEDKIINLSVAEKMHQKILNSNLVLIEDAGHYSNLEQPEQFNTALTQFIGTVNS